MDKPSPGVKCLSLWSQNETEIFPKKRVHQVEANLCISSLLLNPMTVSLKTIAINNGEIRKDLLFHIYYNNL